MSQTGFRDIGPVPLVGGLVAATVMVAGVAFGPPAGVAMDIQLVLAIFVATVILWVTKPVPFAISSVLCVVALYGAGLVDTFDRAVSGFASTLVFFFLFLLVIGNSIAKVDLDDWVANRLVSATSTPRTSVHRLAVTLFLLALFMPSSLARAVTFIPVVDQINDLYELDENSPFRRLGYYVLGHVNPTGSIALMTGGGMAVATAELVNSMVRPISWFEWALYMIPPVIGIHLLAIGTVSHFYAVEDTGHIHSTIGSGTDVATDGFTEPLEPLTRDQRIVVGTLAMAILLWMVGSFLGIPAIIPAAMMIVVFSLPGVRIVTESDLRDINWGIIFLIGTMLSILEVMQQVEAFEFIIDLLLVSLPNEASPTVILAIVFGIAVLVRTMFSGVAPAIVILFPILFEFAGILGFDPLRVGLSLLILLSCTTFIPYNISPALVAYEGGPLSMKEVFLLGVTTLGIGVVIVLLSWTVYWPIASELV